MPLTFIFEPTALFSMSPACMETTPDLGVDATNLGKSHAVTVLLKQVGSFQRAPRGLSESWQKIDQDRLSKKFFVEGGFTAWFAYCLTKHRAEHHSNFIGKAECRRVISDLGPQSDENIRLLAMEVNDSLPSDVTDKINRLRRVAESARTEDFLQQASRHSE